MVPPSPRSATKRSAWQFHQPSRPLQAAKAASHPWAPGSMPRSSSTLQRQPYASTTYQQPMWGAAGSMQAFQPTGFQQLPSLWACCPPPPPPPRPARKAGLVLQTRPLNISSLQPAKQLSKKTSRRHPRFAAARQRRRAAAKQRKQQLLAVPASPVCPPAPHNTNEYLISLHEQQVADEQAARAAAAQQADAAAEWDPSTQQASRSPQQLTLPVTAEDEEEEEAAYPVCPPAPLLTNEYYMSRFEAELMLKKQQAAAVVEARVAEWDPLLQEVTTLQHSTASSLPVTYGPAVADSCSRC